MTTPPDPANLTGPALRDAVAVEVMGWQWHEHWWERRPTGQWNDGVPYLNLPDYPNDPAATRTMEDEIERRGLGEQYATALGDMLAPQGTHRQWEFAWVVIRASGETKCRAILAALAAKERANERR